MVRGEDALAVKGGIQLTDSKAFLCNPLLQLAIEDRLSDYFLQSLQQPKA